MIFTVSNLRNPQVNSRYAFQLFTVCALLLAFYSLAAAQTAPVLSTQTGTNRAIALESITHQSEPFALTSVVQFGADTRTRIVVFANNAQLNANENASAITADVQDAQGRFYPLLVEDALPLSGVPGTTMLVLRLSDTLTDVGDVLLRIALHGLTSNRVRVGIGHVGGGPPNDSGPAQTPPPPPTPTPTATPTPTPTPPPPPPPTTGTRLKVLQWNVAYGRGTDNIIDLNRQVNWLVTMQPDLISLNEVPPENVSQYQSMLQQRTGVTWFSHWVPITPGNTVGQQILSRYPFTTTNSLFMSFGRSVAQVTVNIGGRTINLFSTHLSFESSTWRLVQLGEINAWTAAFPEQRILLGDFNLSPNWVEYVTMTALFNDSWQEAFNAGTAIAYPDNPDGRTRKGRVDYINYSKGASGLRLIEVRMPDQRDLNNKNVAVTVGNSNDWGVRPSDHNFIMATFETR